MPLQKQSQNLSFAQGLDTKSDPFQVTFGKFLSLVNSVFTKGGLLLKRNGFNKLSSLTNTASVLTTFKGNLTAIGQNIQSFSSGQKAWQVNSAYVPCNVSVLPVVRSNTNQSQVDSVIAENGIMCVAYTDQDTSSLSTNSFKYEVLDSVTGQIIIAPTVIADADTTYGYPKIFLLNHFFIIVYVANISSANSLRFIAVNSTSNTAAASSVISTSITPATSTPFDGVVANNTLFLAWNGASSSGVKVALLPSTLILAGASTLDSAHTATHVSVAADTVNQVIYVTSYNSSGTTAYVNAMNYNLTTLGGSFPAALASLGTLNNITSAVQDAGSVSVFYETVGSYSFDASIPNNRLGSKKVSQSAVVTSGTFASRGLGIASKPFVLNGSTYLLASYQSPYQPTYFLMNTSNGSGTPIAKLAYQNGGGYLSHGLPSFSVSGNTASVAYLFKDLIQSVNKDTNVPSGTQVNGIYSQLGVNLASFTLGASASISLSEIGNNLNISGGFLWGYDGVSATENNFFLYPDLTLNADGTYHGLTTATTGGSLIAQKYFYLFTYEWTDNQGNAFRSAPSVPVSITTTGSVSANTILVPTLRLTYKTANPVKIVGYRWSAAQQEYYQFTSITAPSLNSLSADTVSIVDTASDASILGNNLVYTTGGVVENIGPPAFNNITLFDDRLWGVTGEDRNLLQYSKQVIENTPVEMSDLFTVYIAPTISVQGSTGPITALSTMDDKLIIFKKDAIYYINGTGPDNTGSSSQYSQPTFITATVGCANQNSVVFMPEGLMFQSDKGIWVLKRNLSTEYIGAPVEQYNSATVESALTIPGTNQVRFTLNNGTTLMYDYYYGQWGTFGGISGISSTIYNQLHTFINSYNQVFQESPGVYLDGSSPVLISFITSWINLAGLQGYERLYFFYLLGVYYSPHKMALQIAYDYESAPTQQSIITPTFNVPYGSDGAYGQGSPYGDAPALEQWKVFTQRQTCESFQITFNEVYNAAIGQAAGAGLTLSGINMTFGIKKGYKPINQVNSVG